MEKIKNMKQQINDIRNSLSRLAETDSKQKRANKQKHPTSRKTPISRNKNQSPRKEKVNNTYM